MLVIIFGGLFLGFILALYWGIYKAANRKDDIDDC